MAVKIVEVKAEVGAGVRGAGLGVDALKVAAANKQSRLFKRYESTVVQGADAWSLEAPEFPYAKFIDTILPIGQNLCETVYKTLLDKQFPIFITGDHSYSYAIISGIKKANAGSRLGVVWIDAHADLHSPYTTPSGNMNGMPIAITCNIDNVACQINSPGSKALAYWQQMKDTGLPGPKIQPEDIVYIGLRSTEKAEQHLIAQHNITCITVDEVRKQGVEKIVCAVRNALRHCDLLYVSFDVDSMDPTISKGTGTPVAHGLTLEEASLLNQGLAKAPQICAWEVTEINPLQDAENKMAKAVFPLLEKVVHTVEENTYVTR